MLFFDLLDTHVVHRHVGITHIKFNFFFKRRTQDANVGKDLLIGSYLKQKSVLLYLQEIAKALSLTESTRKKANQ